MTDTLIDDDTLLPPPKVIGAPDRIWLCYGELERDDDHSALHQIHDVVTWCEDSVFQSDVQYIRTDLIEQQAQEITELNTMMTYQAKSWGREQDINEETIAEKTAEIARLRADAERLDWLESTGAFRAMRLRTLADPLTLFWEIAYGRDDEEIEGETLRSAIDAALRTEKP